MKYSITSSIHKIKEQTRHSLGNVPFPTPHRYAHTHTSHTLFCNCRLLSTFITDYQYNAFQVDRNPLNQSNQISLCLSFSPSILKVTLWSSVATVAPAITLTFEASREWGKGRPFQWPFHFVTYTLGYREHEASVTSHLDYGNSFLSRFSGRRQ